MRMKKISVIAIVALAIAGILLFREWRPFATNAAEALPEAGNVASETSIKHERPASPEPVPSISPIRPTPFRDGTAAFRVLDRVTGKPVAGASVGPDAKGGVAWSERATDAQGCGLAVLPPDCTLPCDIFVALSAADGGGVIKAVFPQSPATDIVIPLYARLVVQTNLPKFPPGEEVVGNPMGALWCASWPAPQEVFKEALPDLTMKRHQSDYTVGMVIDSHDLDTRGAVWYHQAMLRNAGCDATKLICLREDVKVGAEHVFDIAYGGDVLISYYVSGFDWNMKARGKAVRGESRRIVLEQTEARLVRLIAEDEHGERVAKAHVGIVMRRDLGPDAPQPDGAFFVFRPEGSNRRIAVRRVFFETDSRGEVGLWVLGEGHGEVSVSATKPGHVGAGLGLWSGSGVPDKGTYRIELKRAKQEWAFLTKRGQPLAKCETLKVTDIEPVSLLGQIDYPVFSSDEEGRAPFEQLVLGHRYVIHAHTSQGMLSQEFRWTPGVVIAF